MLGVVGVLHRPLLVDSLPHIARAVTATEEKRGTGLDHTLRFVHMILLNLYTGFMTGSVVAYFIYISPSPPNYCWWNVYFHLSNSLVLE